MKKNIKKIRHAPLCTYEPSFKIYKTCIFTKVDIAKFSVKVGDIYSLFRNILS